MSIFLQSFTPGLTDLALLSFFLKGHVREVALLLIPRFSLSSQEHLVLLTPGRKSGRSW